MNAAQLHNVATWTGLVAAVIVFFAKVLGLPVTSTDAETAGGIIVSLILAAGYAHGKTAAATTSTTTTPPASQPTQPQA